jgi:hypothetical protein
LPRDFGFDVFGSRPDNSVMSCDGADGGPLMLILLPLQGRPYIVTDQSPQRDLLFSTGNF